REGLDEGAHGVEGGGAHLLLELRESIRGEALVDPALVVGEAELGRAHEEVARAEALEGRKPALRRLEVAFEGLDVRRAGRHDAPAEDSDSAHGSLLRAGEENAPAGCADVPKPAHLANRSVRSEEHTSELQSRENLVCRLLLEKKKTR